MAESEPDVSAMSASEVEAEHARLFRADLAAGHPIREWRDDEFSVAEIIEEVAHVAADTGRFHAEISAPWPGAYMVAQMAASLRDLHRPAAKGGTLGDAGSLIAVWLIERADREDRAASIEAAYLAAIGAGQEEGLGRDLRTLVQGNVDGTIDDAEFVRRLKKPHAGLRRRVPSPPRLHEPGAIALGSAESKLTTMLAGAGANSPRAVWEVFKQFAALPVTAEEPERLDQIEGDMLLFEWGIFESIAPEGPPELFMVDLIRQFSVLDADGDYDRIEQLRCSISFEQTPELLELGSNALWSNSDRDRWFTDVEHSDGFQVLSKVERFLSIHVSQDPV
jgi:hypothetical protein